MQVAALAHGVLTESALFSDPDIPFTCSLSVADPALLLVTGSNAAGKSLLTQLICAWAHQEKTLPVSISIRERTGSGLAEMAGFRRTMMFGNECELSTGANSVRVAQAGFHNVLHRKALLLLDEPDMGLSEDYAHAFGELLVREHRNCVAENKEYKGLILVTHSRSLVKGVLSTGALPSFASMSQHETIQDWLADANPRSVEELLALDEVAMARRRTVFGLIEKFKK